MAYVCPRCNQVHPKGAVTCGQAKQMIDKYVRELNDDIRHHLETCTGCPNPEGHVLNLRRLRERRNPKDFVVGAKV